jgi:hypothetical protein
MPGTHTGNSSPARGDAQQRRRRRKCAGTSPCRSHVGSSHARLLPDVRPQQGSYAAIVARNREQPGLAAIHNRTIWATDWARNSDIEAARNRQGVSLSRIRAPFSCSHSAAGLCYPKPYSPEGRGKQERLHRCIREAFLAEAEHHGIESLDQLNDLFTAWAGHVANRRAHAEPGQAPIDRFEKGGLHRQADPALIRDARSAGRVTRRVTRTATVPLEGNSYAVDSRPGPGAPKTWISRSCWAAGSCAVGTQRRPVDGGAPVNTAVVQHDDGDGQPAVGERPDG